MKCLFQSIQVLSAVYLSVKTADYDYASQGSNWSSISGYELCGTSTIQSPIDIVRQSLQHVETTTDISVSYNSQSSLSIKNSSGQTQKVTAADATSWGTLKYDSTNYKLAQYHFHAPSEHTFDGLRYDMELHFVHAEDATTPTKYVVVTVFFNIGEENSFLTNSMFGSLSTTTDNTVSLSTSINPWDLISKSNSQGYIMYNGSFTTPPCTEGGTFILLREWQTLSQAQWSAFTASQPNAGVTDWAYTSGLGNYRVTQAINGRAIQVNGGKLNAGSTYSDGEIAGIVIGVILAVLVFFGVPSLVCYQGTRQKIDDSNLKKSSSVNAKDNNMTEYKQLDSEMAQNKLETKLERQGNSNKKTMNE